MSERHELRGEQAARRIKLWEMKGHEAPARIEYELDGLRATYIGLRADGTEIVRTLGVSP